MGYCTNCGSNVQPGANVCTECGATIPKNTTPRPVNNYQTHQSYQTPPNQSNHVNADELSGYNPSDPGGFGWGLLGFCIPIVGLILFLVWQDDKPNNAKAAGKGALAYIGFLVFIYVILIASAI